MFTHNYVIWRENSSITESHITCDELIVTSGKAQLVGASQWMISKPNALLSSQNKQYLLK